MANRSVKKIRLVKCPKCLKILQEDEDVLVYQCGGCSAILQAKRRNIAPERAQVGELRSETEANNVPGSSGEDIVLPSSPERSSGQETMEKKLVALNLSETNEIQQQECCSLGDSEKNEAEENSRLESNVMNLVAKAAGSSGKAEISPVEKKQSHKTYSAYDESESSSNEREDQLLDENEQWSLRFIRSRKYKEQGGASSSSTFFDKRRNGINTYSEWRQNKSLQLEGRGRRNVTEQLRPNLPLYPREPYRNLSPSYPSHENFDHYSRAHSLQTPPYAGVMSHKFVDYTRERGRGLAGRFSGDMAGHRRNHAGHNSYSSYSASPQRPMEQYYPRWSHQIASDAEDHHHHRNRHELKTQPMAKSKRHVRPTAGGAPFVSCYSCYQNLQLPVDFLIFKKKHHLLRCSTCNTVLRFSLQSRTHLVPAVTHNIKTHRSSNSTSESPKLEKPSSSVKEEELVPVTRGSPLHRLMGYSTVSQVFKASQRPPSI